MPCVLVRGHPRTRRKKTTHIRSHVRRQPNGNRLLMLLEAGMIDPKTLTPAQREMVLKAQNVRRHKRTKARRRFKQREKAGIRTRFGLGSWQLRTQKELKKAGGKN